MEIFLVGLLVSYTQFLCRSIGAKDCTPRMYVKRFSDSLHCVILWRGESLESKILLWQSTRLLFYWLLTQLARKSNITVLVSYPIGVRWIILNYFWFFPLFYPPALPQCPRLAPLKVGKPHSLLVKIFLFLKFNRFDEKVWISCRKTTHVTVTCLFQFETFLKVCVQKRTRTDYSCFQVSSMSMCVLAPLFIILPGY